MYEAPAGFRALHGKEVSMRALMLTAAAALVAGCSSPVAPSGSTAAQETAGRVAGPPQSCVSTFTQENLRVLDSGTVAYGHGRTIYVNTMGAACPGMEPLATLIVEPGLPGRYCRGDHVRGREYGASIPGPTCNLGDWVPYRLP
jgi:hypothetical protein